MLIWVQIHFFLAPLLFFLALVDFIACGYGITTQSSKLILQEWPLRPFGSTKGLLPNEAEKVNNANCKFNYTILEFIYASSVYLIFLVNFNRAYSLYNQNKASLWFGMKGTSISVALCEKYWVLFTLFYCITSFFMSNYHCIILYSNFLQFYVKMKESKAVIS